MRPILARQRDGARRLLPDKIEIDGLYKLDVDNGIWQQVGLDNVGVDLPEWMANDNTRKGIRARLSLDRCLEEEDRIIKERRVLQEWTLEEWDAITRAREATGKFHH